MNYVVLSGLVLFLSVQSFAASYSCEDKDIEATIELDLNENQINGVETVSYKKEIFKKNGGELWGQSSGIGAIQKDYKKGQLFSTTYLLPNGDKLRTIVDPKETFLLKAYALSPGVSKIECVIQ